ncbi:hypothetical protein N1F78_00875 [Seonamhaeicola sp. MEBiC1930]|uniref:glycine-rich domain-containing protein n=1 Tax=Seonamhaeicola sp. MEBiC01930 TaxID=2976768 RepID=UPI0032534FBD
MNVTDKILPELDLDNIVKKTANKNGWSKEQANDIETKYRGFLKLNQIHEGTEFAPDPEIDELWHAHILDTQKYIADCGQLFGYFLHHEPSYKAPNEPNVSLEDASKRTQTLFKENFGIDLNFGIGNDAIAKTCGSQTRCKTKIKGNQILAA